MTAALIVFGGLPGVGKTTIARQLAASIPAVLLRIDVIEVALHHEGVEVEGQGYAVAYALAQSNLRLGLCVVADSVNPIPLTRDAWRAVADEGGAALLEVEIICSDTAEHRRRIEERTTDIAGFTLPTWDEVVGRDYRDWDRERLVIDTAVTTASEAVATIRSALAARP